MATAIPALAATAGDLDPSFSGDGRQTTEFAGRSDPSAIAVQPDGRARGRRYGL